ASKPTTSPPWSASRGIFGPRCSRSSRMRRCLTSLLFLIHVPVMAACPALLDRSVESIDERPCSLCEFAGSVVLIVNTASRCGYTPQYQGLEALYRKYRSRGLVILRLLDAGALLRRHLAVRKRLVFHLLHARLAFLEPRRLFVRKRPGLLALLDAPLLVGLPLVDARCAARLPERRQRERRECGDRNEINGFHASSPCWWLLRNGLTRETPRR